MSSTTKARLSQERSRQRREALLDAAIELFAEGGSRAVTHRAVARRAGLPSATTTYYFESIDALVSDALSRHIERWISDLRELASASNDSRLHIDEAQPLLTAAFAARTPDKVRTQLAITLAALADDRLRPQVIEALDALRVLTETVLRSVGVDDPGTLSHTMIQLIGGSALTRLTGRYDDAEEAAMVFDAMRRLIATWQMPDAVVTEALPRPQ